MHLPQPIESHHKHFYTEHYQLALTFFSILSFAGATYSAARYFSTETLLWFFFPFLAFSVVYYLVSLYVQGRGGDFNLDEHNELVQGWKPIQYPTIDIFLPIYGEDINIIRHAWHGVDSVRKNYQGKVEVYCLDDGNDVQAKELAQEFNFNYLVRDNRGHFKKAGNLHHGYKNSSGEFIVIFDADFRPRADFLDELMPYFYHDPKLGIVQSPQFFDVHKHQNWLERGAGAVQEYFYRSIQSARQQKNGAICVGSNAIYRRKALDANGGTTLIEHSEDVHTGFDLRRHGWHLKYVPIVLAKGLCPNDLPSFFRQQYRWCKGSMSLLKDKKFWNADISLKTRLCYITGFFYYIHTGIAVIIAPLIPISLVTLFPEQAKIANYIPLIPALAYTYIIFPLWHKNAYRSETISVKVIYAWAHLFAIIDTLFSKEMPWHSTGGGHKAGKSIRYALFVILLTIYSFSGGVLWISSALWYMNHWSFWDFLPLLLSGIVYTYAVLRIIKFGIFDSHEKGSQTLKPENLQPVTLG